LSPLDILQAKNLDELLALGKPEKTSQVEDRVLSMMLMADASGRLLARDHAKLAMEKEATLGRAVSGAVKAIGSRADDASQMFSSTLGKPGLLSRMRKGWQEGMEQLPKSWDEAVSGTRPHLPAQHFDDPAAEVARLRGAGHGERVLPHRSLDQAEDVVRGFPGTADETAGAVAGKVAPEAAAGTQAAKEVVEEGAKAPMSPVRKGMMTFGAGTVLGAGGLLGTSHYLQRRQRAAAHPSHYG